MSTFESVGISPSPSAESVRRRREIDAEIAEAMKSIPESIDLGVAVVAVEEQIRRATDDEALHRLNVRRAALLQCREQSPALNTVRSVEHADVIPELSPEKQKEHDELGYYQTHDERSPSRRFGRLRSVQSPVLENQEKTGVRPLNLDPLHIADELDIGKAAM